MSDNMMCRACDAMGLLVVFLWGMWAGVMIYA